MIGHWPWAVGVELSECVNGMQRAWRRLLDKKDQSAYEVMLLEAKVPTTSSLLLHFYLTSTSPLHPYYFTSTSPLPHYYLTTTSLLPHYYHVD